MNVQPISLSTTPIYLFNNGIEHSQGTGFFYLRKMESGPAVFLVTNQHVLTGSAPSEMKPPVGDVIEFFFHKSADDPSQVKRIKMPLYTQQGNPRWISTELFPTADIAIIPIPFEIRADCFLHCVDSSAAEAIIKIRPTTEVTFVGYPDGFYDRVNSLPLWKSGTVASEPDVDFNGKPLFLVDAALFKGMSGSPVFAYSNGTYETPQGGISTTPGFVSQFLGIFSSYYPLVEFRPLTRSSSNCDIGIEQIISMQLNDVWKARTIVDTINAIDIERYCNETLSQIRRLS